MSKAAMNWAHQQRIADQTLTSLLRAIAFTADKGTGECGKSQADLAAEAGLTERAVRANLVVLERLDIIARHMRYRGKYGRTTDLITLALDRNFDVSRAAIRAIRQSLKRPLQPERGSGNKPVSYRNQIPLQPERGSGPYNTGDTGTPYQEGRISEVEGSSATSGETNPADRACLPSNVIPLTMRGAA